MKLLRIDNISIKGICACVPKEVIYNKDYNYLTEAENKFLIKNIGIEQRRIAPKNTPLSYYGTHASRKLLQDLNWDKNDIDVLIVVTQTPDYFIPSVAPIIQSQLGLPNDIIAYHIGLGCSGFVIGLHTIASLMNANKLKKGLLVTGDISSYALNTKDKTTYPIFGDAVCATAMEYDTVNGSGLHFNIETDGSGYSSIMIPHGGTAHPIDETSLTEIEISPGTTRNKIQLQLDGTAILNFTLSSVYNNIRKLIEQTGKSPDEVKTLVLHQANKIINDSLSRKLKLTNAVSLDSLKRYGNTSSASIPLSILENYPAGMNHLQNVLLSGFGVGLSIGSLYTEKLDVYLSGIIEK